MAGTAGENMSAAGKGEWVRCDCLRSFWGADAASQRVQLHRCKAKHVQVDHLDLHTEPSPENVLVVILSYSDNKSMVRQTRKHLIQAGFPEETIRVRYGYNIDRDRWMGRQIEGNEIVHLGFLHYWAPYVESLLVAGTACKKHTILWVEDDVRLCARFSDIMQEFRHSPKPICWLGYEKKKWTGAQLIGFKGDGLKLAWQAASNRPNPKHVFRHLDCLWIHALCDDIHWPHRSLATQADHWSATANFLRKGQHKKRILGSEGELECKRQAGCASTSEAGSQEVVEQLGGWNSQGA